MSSQFLEVQHMFWVCGRFQLDEIDNNCCTPTVSVVNSHCSPWKSSVLLERDLNIGKRWIMIHLYHHYPSISSIYIIYIYHLYISSISYIYISSISISSWSIMIHHDFFQSFLPPKFGVVIDLSQVLHVFNDGWRIHRTGHSDELWHLDNLSPWSGVNPSLELYS